MTKKRLKLNPKSKIKYNGFTLMELLIVIAIIGIMLMIALPSISGVGRYEDKSRVNTTYKIILRAVDFWIKDNNDATKRPANFSAMNSQGHTVGEYISNDDIFEYTNLNKNTRLLETNYKKGSIKIVFENGILTVSYVEDVGNTENYKMEKDLLVDFNAANRDQFLVR